MCFQFAIERVGATYTKYSETKTCLIPNCVGLRINPYMHCSWSQLWRVMHVWMGIITRIRSSCTIFVTEVRWPSRMVFAFFHNGPDSILGGGLALLMSPKQDKTAVQCFLHSVEEYFSRLN